MKTGRYNLKELLTHNEIEQIIIPEIQRDYVWQVENVTKLVQSILERFHEKKENKITLQINGLPLGNDTILDYLQHQYDRLIHNLKIGFIYAYHDNEYSGKFFLIDGQQRFTTLYLLLLCLYKNNQKQSDFENVYFKDNQLKIDYKVREASHDFMVEFVKNELAEKPQNIKESKVYYTEYYDDITIRNILNNYNCIEQLIKKEECTLELIHFIEEFVEVNYFDTHLSQQGEQLYLYMNSRGESLSYQELIKSEMIKKIVCQDKLKETEKKKDAGKYWEDWQNFFWLKKDKNENADKGFQEFLKWASIIQICTSDNLELIRLTVNDRGIDRLQTIREAKENYIHRVPTRINEQNQILSQYQLKTTSFNFDYLSQIFNSVEFLYSLDADYLPILKDWLANNMKTMDYVILCPLIYYIAYSQWDDPEIKKRDIQRMAMFLKNISWFESTLGKAPDSATIDAIELVKELCTANVTDVTFFLEAPLKAKFKTILTDSELLKLQILKNQDVNPNAEVTRTDLEKFIWEISLNENISKFTEGDISILFDCVNFDSSDFYQNKILSENNLIGLSVYQQVLEKVIIEFAYEDILRRALLTITDSDYLLDDNGGSWHFESYIQRYSLIQKNKNNTEWHRIFKDKKNNIVLLFMQLMKQHLNENIPEFLNSLCQNYKGKDWREPFIKEPALLKYCSNKKILWEDENRIILLSSIKAGSAIEIQIMLLKLKIDKAFTFFFHNICILDFNIENGQWIALGEGWSQPDRYAMDIKYQNAEWHFSILYRNKNIDIQELTIFEKYNGWKLVTTDCLRAVKADLMIYYDDPSKSIMENVEEAYNIVLSLRAEITQIVTENQIKSVVENNLIL